MLAHFSLVQGEQPRNRDLERYEKDFRTMHFERVQEDLRRRFLLRMINGLDAPRVLEVGCGFSSIFEDLSKAMERTIVEPIEEHLRSAFSRLDDGVTGIRSTLEEVASRLTANFDLVVMSSVLHEARDQVRLLQAARECLDESGYLALVTNNPRSIHRILGVELGLLSSLNERTSSEVAMQQHQALSDVELSNLLEECGFSIQFVATEIPKILSHRQMDEALSVGAISPGFIDELCALSPWLPHFGSEIFILARRT